MTGLAHARHPDGGAVHPMATAHGGGRVYDALPPRAQSYEVPAHREIVARAPRWTTA